MIAQLKILSRRDTDTPGTSIELRQITRSRASTIGDRFDVIVRNESQTIATLVYADTNLELATGIYCDLVAMLCTGEA